MFRSNTGSNSPCYPSSGNSFHGGPSRYRYNFGSYESSPPSNEYYYGRGRRRPYYWERDQDAYNRLWRNRRRRERGRDNSSPSREKSPEPKPEPKPKPPKEEIVKQLNVKKVNLYIKENTENSKTDAYECTDEDREADESGKKPSRELVVRRGNFMKLSITFDRPYKKEKHDLRLRFSIGKNPTISKSTMAQFKIDEDGKKAYDPFEWGAYLESRSGNDISVMVHIAADCIVGEWNLTMKTLSEGKDKDGKDQTLVFTYEHDDDVTILFNPWCKDDGVYMGTTDLLNEYILNENGCVYRGNVDTRGAKPWNFGQFEYGILDVCLYLLRSGFKDGISKKMADPVQASRIIAKMVNSNDDKGVLIGNWSGEYEGGVSPSTWVGSPRILKQFMKSGPVKYGQCWVFSCLTTTVCRCLGIPCRSVTNFESAHDTDASNLIEKVFYEKNGKLEKVSHNHDSVWNFHVWNEAWLARPDLDEKGFDGWQVIDATPQEKSDNVHTCGPCPISAVKEGRVDLNYDTSFVFSEVNADEAHFKLRPDGSYEELELLTNKIGKFISTKVPDGKPYMDRTFWSGGMHFDRYAYDEKKREDLTLEYKYPEGSEEERKAVEQAFGIAKKKRMMLPRFRTGLKKILDPYTEVPVVEKVQFTLKHSNEIMIGSDLPLEIIAKNGGTRTQNIWYIRLSVSPKSYIGDTGPAFFDTNFDGFVLESGQEKRIKAVVTVEKYFPHLVEQANLYIEVYGAVAFAGSYSPHQETVKSHDFRFRRPDLDIKGPEKGQKGQPVEFKVSFKNPAPVALTNCSVAMGSSGFEDTEDKKQPDVDVGETYTGKFTMVPKRKKEHEVVFTFDCKEMKDISGSTSIVIS